MINSHKPAPRVMHFPRSSHFPNTDVSASRRSQGPGRRCCSWYVPQHCWMHWNSFISLMRSKIRPSPFARHGHSIHCSPVTLLGTRAAGSQYKSRCPCRAPKRFVRAEFVSSAAVYSGWNCVKSPIQIDSRHTSFVAFRGEFSGVPHPQGFGIHEL